MRYLKLTAIAAISLSLLGGCAARRPVPPRGPLPPPSNDPHRYSQIIMEQFDINNDGRISADEFALATIEIFESLDRNGDLRLDREELGGLWNSDSIRADLNRDGVLSFVEILEDQDRQFKEFDRDRDGYLSADELEQFSNARLNPAR